MNKHEMRDYLCDLEERIDKSLSKWKKYAKIENGEAVQVAYQFEQNHILLDIFYLDGDENIHLQCLSPRMGWNNRWKGLTDETNTKVMDRIGNFAQIAMDPKRK